MWLVLGLLQLLVLVDTESKMTKLECDSYMRQLEPQVETVMECLIKHYNLNRLLVQADEKMALIELKLKEALKNHKDPAKPQTKFDDILEINESNQHCQRQQQIFQALRRKLEWYNLMNDKYISHFDWPPAITRSKWKSQSYDEDPELKLFRKNATDSQALDGIQCLVMDSLRNFDVETERKKV